MIRKTTLLKRKLRGISRLVLISLLIFLGVFGICWGLSSLLKNHAYFRSPLAKIASGKNTYTITTKIQDLCVESHINCTAITINSDNTATVTLDVDEQVLLSLQKDLSRQFTSLQLTIGHLTIEGKRFRRLDFRFDTPVISY